MRPVTPAPSAMPGRPRPAASPDEAARQFEAVLVRQFVDVMTKDLFQSEEEGMLTGQADLQRDTLTDTLTDHLVESGAFGVADLMMAQWRRAGRVPAETAEAPDAGPASLEMPNVNRLRLEALTDEPARPAPRPTDEARSHPSQSYSAADALRDRIEALGLSAPADDAPRLAPRADLGRFEVLRRFQTESAPAAQGPPTLIDTPSEDLP